MSLFEKRVMLLVEALRSGKFKQTRGALHNEEGYCCLGVACEVAMANGLALDVQKRGDTNIIYNYNGSDSVLPEEVIFWYGFDNTDPQFMYPSKNGKSHLVGATHLNDALGLSFDKIADLFEQKILSEGK